MRMDAPSPALPMYDEEACHLCGQKRGVRREVEHPQRGIVLACGICIFALEFPR